MTKPRHRFSPEEKVRILRRHLLDKVPVSDLCDELGLNPNVFYSWQKAFGRGHSSTLPFRPPRRRIAWHIRTACDAANSHPNRR